jgi:TatD DNase family protein
MPVPFINIHTHLPENSDDVLSVRNYFLQEIEDETNFPYTTGIHPWHVEQFTDLEIIRMFEDLQTTNCIAIGETGLDKISKASFNRQREVFEIHLDFALKNNYPLIIHNVRAWNEIIEYKRRYNEIPFIFHGYQGNAEITRQLLRTNCYYSFGESLQKKRSLGDTMRQIPPALLFFETDESSIDIREIYKSAAVILGSSLEDLREQVFLNFNNVFKVSME